MQTFGIVAGGDEQRGRGVDPHAVNGEEIWCGGFEKWGDPVIELFDLLFEVGRSVSQR